MWPALVVAFAASACVGRQTAIQSPSSGIPRASPRQPKLIRIEAETTTLHGLTVEHRIAGYSGVGYVTGFDHDGDRLDFDVDAAPGVYDLVIGFASPDSVKGYELRVGSEKTTGMFPHQASFGPHDAGLYALDGGTTHLSLGKGWGYYDVDYIELRPAVPAPALKPPSTPADSEASAEARALLGYLVDLHGRKTLTGQQELDEIAYIRSKTGKEPAIGAFDLMEYSPSRRAHGADPKGLVEKIIAWANRPAIVSLSWHWNAPMHLVDQPGKEWWRGFNTDATTFDLVAALDAPDSEEYQAILHDIDAIAVELKKLDAAHIPVLWRPLHEAEGGWFWWGSKGPSAFVRLYQLLFDRLVHHHGLHNLLWVYSPPDGGIEATDWYPGDQWVDVVGADVYTDPSSTISGPWRALERIYGGRKLIALGETGSLPDPAAARRVGVHWAYMNLWSGKFLHAMPRERLNGVYTDPDTITRDQLPDTFARTRAGVPGS